MNKPTVVPANTIQAQPTEFHKLASFIGGVANAAGKVASIPYHAIKNTFADPYSASLKAKGYGKKK